MEAAGLQQSRARHVPLPRGLVTSYWTRVESSSCYGSEIELNPMADELYFESMFFQEQQYFVASVAVFRSGKERSRQYSDVTGAEDICRCHRHHPLIQGSRGERVETGEKVQSRLEKNGDVVKIFFL